jgi:predicted Zn-ribbon and HTH transcriptional regulator
MKEENKMNSKCKICTCKTCGHEFETRIERYLRKKQKITRTCGLCDYKWESRVQKPKQCPSCKSYLWKDGYNYYKMSATKRKDGTHRLTKARPLEEE